MCVRRLGIKCPNGTVTTEKGYTSRAKKYGAFRQKYISDETYARLKALYITDLQLLEIIIGLALAA